MRLFSLFDNPLGRLRGRARRNIRYALFGSWSAKTKGDRGERRVAGILSRVRFCSDNHLLNNLMLPWPDGGTCQIDHVIVADSGIYVVEVKNYSGWIFANEKNQYWTQVLTTGYRGESIKNRIYNPIRQNASHIRCIRRILGNCNFPMYSIIVFSDDAEFKALSYEDDDVFIAHFCNLRKVIERIDARFSGSLSNEEVNGIYHTIIASLVDVEKSEHVENVRQYISKRQERVDNGLCPRCGAPLVVRTARSGPNAGGSFLGCSAYPRCRYTKSLK